jgi:hypothetical protein
MCVRRLGQDPIRAERPANTIESRQLSMGFTITKRGRLSPIAYLIGTALYVRPEGIWRAAAVGFDTQTKVPHGSCDHDHFL